MDKKILYLTDRLKELSKTSLLYAKKAHEIIFSEDPNDIAIIGYLNYAGNLLASAKAIYYSNIDILEHHDIDDFFYQFDVFILEVLNNIHTNHSHQWSDIEFNNLNEKFDYCVLSQ